MSEIHHVVTSEMYAVLNRPDVRADQFEVLYERSLTPTAFVEKDGCFLSVNTAFAEMLGYSRYEIIGKKSWQDLTHRDDIEANEREIDALVKGEQQDFRIQKRYLHKDGKYVYCVVQVNRIPASGELVHFIKQAHEIPVAARGVIVERDERGNPVIVPTVRLEDFLKRQWKTIVGILVPAVGWVGYTANDYYATKARAEYQQNQITQQAEQLKDFQRRLDAHPK